MIITSVSTVIPYILKERNETDRVRIDHLRHAIDAGRQGESMSIDAETIKRQTRQQLHLLLYL